MNPYVYMKNNRIATTVKIDTNIYDEFKVLGIRHKLNLQRFVEKCAHLYVEDNTFRGIVDSYNVPLLSTSGSLSGSLSGSFGN